MAPRSLLQLMTNAVDGAAAADWKVAAATTVLFSSSQSPVAFWVPFFIRFSMMLCPECGTRLTLEKNGSCIVFIICRTHLVGSWRSLSSHFLTTASQCTVLIVFCNFNINSDRGNQWRKLV